MATVGHHWTSSLITSLDDDAKGPEGAIVAIPRADVMLTAPVVGAATVDSLESIMLLCHEIYDPADAGVSPHVWWSWHDGLYRITDRQRDGEVDIEPSMNLSACYFVGALEDLVNPCEECGRPAPSDRFRRPGAHSRPRGVAVDHLRRLLSPSASPAARKTRAKASPCLCSSEVSG